MTVVLSFADIWRQIASVIESVRFPSDIIDILLMTYIIYKSIKIVRETRAVQLVKGLIFLLALYAVSALCDLRSLGYVLGNISSVALFAIIVLFQPELRRILEKVGRSKFFLGSVLADTETAGGSWQTAIDPIVGAVMDMSSTCTGALIVLERNTKLGDIVERATLIDAIPSAPLIEGIFFHNSPLHDGGLIIRNGRLHAAGCFFQPSEKVENISLGSRHRAGIGVSEICDAIVIIVSEETGTVSIATDGRLSRNYTRESLVKLLTSLFVADPANKDEKRIKKIFMPKSYRTGGNSNEKN